MRAQTTARWYANALLYARDASRSWWRRAGWYTLAGLAALALLVYLWQQRERRAYLENQLDVVRRREKSAQLDARAQQGAAKAVELDRQARDAAARAKTIEKKLDDVKTSRDAVTQTIKNVTEWESLRDEYDKL